VVLVFLVATPFLVTYIYGYRWDFELNRIRKTGTLHVRTFPKKAEVYVNGKLKRPQTPESINGLLERVYEVKVWKEGYLPWIKKLKVEPGVVTRTDLVYLFPDSLEKEDILGGEILDFKIYANQDKAAFIKKDQGVGILNLKNNEKKIISQEASFEKLSWSVKGENLLLWSREKGFYVFDIDKDDDLRKLEIETGISLDDVHWSQNDKNVLYFLNNESKIVRLDILENKRESPIATRVLAYAVFQNKLFYILDDKNVYSFDERNGSTKQVTRQSLEIEENSGERNVFQISQEGEIVLVTNKKELYLIDETYIEGVKKIDSEVEKVVWQGGSEKIAYTNQNGEVWVYYLEDKEFPVVKKAGEKEMVLRYQGEISDLSWFFGFEYLIVGCNDKLKVIELDSRDVRNIVDLVELDKNYATKAEYSWEREKLYLWNNGISSIELERK
jgi:hypothetical protein